jgi:hypothetical protein
MSNFNKLVNDILTEMANVAGGVGSVFDSSGSVNVGSTAGSFPAKGDSGYAPGETRWAFGASTFKIDKPSKPGKKGSKSRRRNTPKVPIHRRNLGPSM